MNEENVNVEGSGSLNDTVERLVATDEQVAQGESDYVAETNVPTELEQPNVEMKMPIFIGCTDPDQVDAILKAIDANRYEPALMAPDILAASTNNWLYSRMSVDEQAANSARQRDERHRSDGLKYANELLEHFQNLNKGERHRTQLFKIYELKQYYTQSRHILTDNKYGTIKLSNRDVENLVDLMLLHGYLTPTVAGAKKHEQVFAITVDPVARLEHLQRLDSGYEVREQELLARRKQVADEISRISGEIEGALETQTDAKPEKKKRAKANSGTGDAEPKPKRSPKKKTASGEQVAPGDAVNDR